LSFKVLLCGPSDLELIVISLATRVWEFFIDHRYHHLLSLILFRQSIFYWPYLFF